MKTSAAWKTTNAESKTPPSLWWCPNLKNRTHPEQFQHYASLSGCGNANPCYAYIWSKWVCWLTELLGPKIARLAEGLRFMLLEGVHINNLAGNNQNKSIGLVEG